MGPFIGYLGIRGSNVFSLLLALYFVHNVFQKRYRNIFIYIGFFLLMVVYSFISLIWSDYVQIGFTITFPLLTCFMAMAVIASFNESELQLFLKSLSIFTIFVLLLAVFEILTGMYIFFDNVDFIHVTNNYTLHYPGVVFVNPNDLTQYLLVGVPLIVYKQLKGKKQIILSIALFVVTIFVLINTASRLSHFSIVLLTAAYTIGALLTKRKKLWIYILFFVIAFLGLMETQYGVQNLIESLKLPDDRVLADEQLAGTDDRAAATVVEERFVIIDTTEGYYSIRSVIYKKLFDLGIKNTPFGTGLGGSYTISVIGPHNMFLFIFTDLGIIFAIGFAFILLKALFLLFKSRKIVTYSCHLSLIALSILVIFPIFSSISSGNEQRKIIWIFLGIVFAIINNNGRNNRITQKDLQ